MVSVASGLLQALALLGKLGGRNRRFLKDPLELDLKDNPEHGLRLILTFQPSTSFLVPLDRCLALSSQSLLSPNSTSSPLTNCIPPYSVSVHTAVAGPAQWLASDMSYARFCGACFTMLSVNAHVVAGPAQ